MIEDENDPLRTVDFNSYDGQGFPPLYYAVVRNSETMCKLLIEAGGMNNSMLISISYLLAKVNSRYLSGVTALHVAVERGSFFRLISKNISLNFFHIHILGFSNILHLLLEFSANINAQDENGYASIF